MATDFWDTSAFAKLYLNEIGSVWAAARARVSDVAVSQLAHAEMASLIARRQAVGEFDAQTATGIYRRYLNDTNRFEVIALDEELLFIAAQLLLSGTFGTRMRSLDAIQLATARWWFEQARALNIEPGAFIVADGSLRDAALALGLAVENPEDHE